MTQDQGAELQAIQDTDQIRLTAQVDLNRGGSFRIIEVHLVITTAVLEVVLLLAQKLELFLYGH